LTAQPPPRAWTRRAQKKERAVDMDHLMKMPCCLVHNPYHHLPAFRVLCNPRKIALTQRAMRAIVTGRLGACTSILLLLTSSSSSDRASQCARLNA
jgi:hypothetical protein